MDMTLKDANQLLADRVTLVIEESRQMIEGDMWLNGAGLIIKKPRNDAATLSEMKEGFSSQNALAEVTNRRADGLLGREPVWTLLKKDGTDLTGEEEKSVEQMIAAIVQIWNSREILNLIRSNYINALIGGKSELHPFVPPAYKDEKGNVLTKAQMTLEEALEILHFEVVSPASAGVFLQENSRKPYSVFKYTKNEKTVVEFSFVDADGLTHFKIFTEEEFGSFLKNVFPTSLGLYQTRPIGKKETSETALDLGGKLFLYELDLGSAFITETMKANQRGISLAKTMKGRNTYTAGFRERHWLNAEKPQKEIEVVDPNNPNQLIKVKVPASLTLGAGSATFSTGSLIRDETGKVIGRSTPTLTVIEPVEVKTFIEAKDDDYLSILAEASQTHVLANDVANISGISRRDSRSEHEKKLKSDKPPVDAEGRYIIEFMMAFAAFVTNRTAEYEKFRCDFNSIVDAGLPTPEEKEDNRKAYATGEISLETLMSRNGVEDTDAELSKIKSEDGYEFSLLTKAAKAYSDAGGTVPIRVFIDLLPISEKNKKKISGAVGNEWIKEPVR